MNDKSILEEALNYANELSESRQIKGFLIQVKDLIFEERIKMKCFYCGRYGNNWRCPPKIPDIDYCKMLHEFNNCAVIYVQIPFSDENFDEIRTESSRILHKGILAMEKYLWNQDYPTYLSFIGGACKLCKNGCGKEKCNNPYLSRTPVEAIGVNLVKSLEKYDFHISFPPKDYITRCGLLLW